MADFILKYADSRGQIHQQVAAAGSEKELREKYSQQGFLIYSIKPRTSAMVAQNGKAVSSGPEPAKRFGIEKSDVGAVRSTEEEVRKSRGPAQDVIP